MDLTTIAAGLGSIKSAMEIAKTLKDTDLSIEKAETKLQLAELISTLADAKMQIVETRDLLQKKEQECKKLQEKLNLKDNLKYEQPFYWKINGDEKDGPFCQKCYDSNNRLIRLQGGGNDKWQCYECKIYFYGPNYRKPAARRTRGTTYRTPWNI
jgi:ribosomal protein L37AE/L43A